MGLQAVPRKMILSLADSPSVNRFVNRFGLVLGAARFVSGNSLEDGIEAVLRLNAKGLKATLDNLGESVNDAAAAERAADLYVRMLQRIGGSGVDSNVSVKLTQIGLDVDPKLCLANITRVVGRAAELGNFVRIDMEDSNHTAATIEVFKRIRSQFANVGLVIQSYLYRSEEDLRELEKGGIRANLRLCKGAYNEPPDRAFPTRPQVDRNFQKLIEMHLLSGCYTAIATHNEMIIAAARRFIEKNRIPREQFEFQMLYGIRSALQEKLAAQGYTVRVYVPFGTEWYPYFMRRLAERPANVFFVLRNLLKR